MKHLHERMDDLFANGTPWQHRTLRTLFDPSSAEWGMTTMAEKAAILKKLQASGERLGKISVEYKYFYEKDLDRTDIANDFEDGLIEIAEYLLDSND
ncbi:MAG TPA: hypothetical protein VNS32_10045 [Flavisolibacter sp.]|nr:hypothetical protein [Flavisolibacter sp.]